MSKIVFWNVQRLGSATEKERREMLKNIIDYEKSDLTVMCELTLQCQFPTPVNLTYRAANAYQLCYGAVDKQLNDQSGLFALFQVVRTPEWKQANFKGGSIFRNLADRAVAYLGNGFTHNTHVYAFHAPASNKAVKTVSLAACHLNSVHGNNPWLMIGDMNVEPDVLARARVGINLAGLICSPKKATHKGGKELDYVITNLNNVNVVRIGKDLNHNFSDHSPIVARFD